MIERETVNWPSGHDEARRRDARSDASAPHVPAMTAEEAEETEFQRQMEVGREVMRKHRNVLAALAK